MDDKTSRSVSQYSQKSEPTSSNAGPWGGRSPSYARRETIYRVEGRNYGCWASNVTAACESTSESYINDAAVMSMQEIGKCGGSGKEVDVCNHT